MVCSGGQASWLWCIVCPIWPSDIPNNSLVAATVLQWGSQGSQNCAKRLRDARPSNSLGSIWRRGRSKIRFLIDFYLQNGAKMSPKWEGKKWENLALGTLGGQGGPQRAPKAPEEPQSSKNEAQGPPKWIPRGAQRPQNGAQATPRAPKMEPKRPQDKLPKCAQEAFTIEPTYKQTQR